MTRSFLLAIGFFIMAWMGGNGFAQETPPSAPATAPAEAAPAPAASPSAPTDAPPAATDAPPAPKPDTKTEANPTGSRHYGFGPFVHFLFHRYNSPYGDFDGPSVWWGGRAYGYFGQDRTWRLGVMGSGGKATNRKEVTLHIQDPLYTSSTERTVSAGYGGLTAEYILRASPMIEFPIGFMLGGGGGRYVSHLTGKEAYRTAGLQMVHEENEGYLALMPMTGVDANLGSWARMGIHLGYLFAEPFTEHRFATGFSLMFGLSFGHFTD